MGKISPIEWCDATWNPWMGCTKKSAGCENCYMFREQKQFGHDPTVLRKSKTKFRDPLKWEEPQLIFVCSWSDFFHEDVPKEWRRDAWEIMYHAHDLHTFLLLTKRPENIKDMLPVGWIEGQHKKWPHIWFGATVENQEMADLRIPFLFDFPAAVRFVSCEPLLESIDLIEPLNGYPEAYGDPGDPDWQQTARPLDWVIVGGESGSNCRSMDSAWAYSILEQCKRAGTPFFMKQMSGNTKALREAISVNLMIREFPNAR